MNVWLEVLDIVLMPFKWAVLTMFTTDIYGVSIGGIFVAMFCVSIVVNAIINSATTAGAITDNYYDSKESKNLRSERKKANAERSKYYTSGSNYYKRGAEYYVSRTDYKQLSKYQRKRK